jgi:hypothetical protein
MPAALFGLNPCNAAPRRQVHEAIYRVAPVSHSPLPALPGEHALSVIISNRKLMRMLAHD